MERILPDIASVLDISKDADYGADPTVDVYAGDEARPAEWWQPTLLSPETPIGKILEVAVKQPLREVP
jgi:hypothetical protein